MTVPSKTASFGFLEVPEDQKEELVGQVFTSVANRYDLMNDLMSGGVHRLWKDAFVDWLNPQPGMRVLDVAGGTGDIAVRIAKRAKARGGEAEVVICDINAAMLNEGLKRSDVLGTGTIRWVCGNAECLPMPDASVDAYTLGIHINMLKGLSPAQARENILAVGESLLALAGAKHLSLDVESYVHRMFPPPGISILNSYQVHSEDDDYTCDDDDANPNWPSTTGNPSGGGRGNN